jgi:hypothetical protein
VSRAGPAMAALVVAAAEVSVAVAGAVPDARGLVLALGAAAVGTLALALWWRPNLLTPALLALAASSATVVAGHPDTSGAVIPAAALLVLTGELAGWSHDRRSVVTEPPFLAGARLRTTAAVGIGGLLVAALVVAASGLPMPGGIVPELVGLAAASTVVGLTMRPPVTNDQ